MARPKKKQAEQNESRLKQCRKEKYKSAALFAEAVRKAQGKEFEGGLNNVTYYNFENQKKPLSRNYAELFGKLLDVRPEYLLYSSDLKTNEDVLVNHYIGINIYHKFFADIVRSSGYQLKGVMKKDTQQFVNDEGQDFFIDSAWFTDDYVFMFVSNNDGEHHVHPIPGNVWANFQRLIWDNVKFLFEYTISNYPTV